MRNLQELQPDPEPATVFGRLASSPAICIPRPRRTFGILAIAQRHGRLFLRLVAAQARPA